MGNTRFTYGMALGPENNFYSKETAGLIAVADATPNVYNGGLFYTNNTSNTEITDFDFGPRADRPNCLSQNEGKVIRVVFLDDSTTLVNATNLKLANGTNYTPGANSSIDLMFHNSAWYETGRTQIENGSYSLSGASSAGADQTYNVAGLSVIGIADSCGIYRLTSGVAGQRLTLIMQESASVIIANSDATDTIVLNSTSLATYVLTSNQTLDLINYGSRWYETNRGSYQVD